MLVIDLALLSHEVRVAHEQKLVTFTTRVLHDLNIVLHISARVSCLLGTSSAG